MVKHRQTQDLLRSAVAHIPRTAQQISKFRAWFTQVPPNAAAEQGKVKKWMPTTTYALSVVSCCINIHNFNIQQNPVPAKSYAVSLAVIEDSTCHVQLKAQPSRYLQEWNAMNKTAQSVTTKYENQPSTARTLSRPLTAPTNKPFKVALD